jgi:hypothetical protein
VAVLGRVLFSSAERVDLPDLLSIDSYAAGDWQYFIQSLVGTSKPYILAGFDIIDPQNAIGTQACSVRVADSVAYYPGSSAGPFYYGLPSGNSNSVPLVPELRKNAVNYVYLTLSTFNASVDTRAFWDPDRNGGIGGEFTQDINTESVIQVQVNVSTGSFPANTIPVAIVTVGAVVITAIEDARDLMFRLGNGGISPNPYGTFNFRALPATQYEREEPATIMTSSSDPNPFQGADKNIYNLKEWMDIVMTKLKELGGTTFWYEDTSTFAITNIFHDALATTFKSKGKYVHSSATAGNLTWTEDLIIKSVSDPKDIIVRASTIQLANEQVAYLPLQRALKINSFDQAVSWTNGQNYVNTVGGSIGYFANLSKGDWIKKIGDGGHLSLQVQEFYDTVNIGGSVTTAANARSIRLSAAYQGSTANDLARYDKGVYLSTDVVVQNRSNAAITAAGGNFSWLAQRSDTIEGIGSIQAFTLSGTLSNANGSTAQATVTAHGLLDGDRITVAAPAAQAGTYSVEVQDANNFFINTTNTTTGVFTANYGLATTVATTNGYGLQLESATNNFESGETVVVAGTTNYNGSYAINARSSTQFQFPFASAPALESTGTATLPRLDVRSEEGVTKVVQGETIDIGAGDSDNIQRFIGMSSLAETHPTYFIPASYNTLANGVNYNSDPSDNLSARVSKLTAMMADKAQDKTLKYLCNANTVINTANGGAQEITFTPALSTLTILQPGSAGNAVVTLPNTAPGISLLVNQSAYVTINRNAATTPSIVITSNATIPVDENVIVIASRLSDGVIYIWNGQAVVGAAPLVPSGAALIKVTGHDPVSLTLPTGNPVLVDNYTINTGDLVLFSALTSNANRVYKAVGTGTNITSWTPQFEFNGAYDPTNGDTVIILKGDGFTDQIGKFTGTNWVFNDKVRYFNGADYWEQSNLVTSTLADNTTNNVFTVNYASSEHMIVDFSLNRGTAREAGTIHITTDGINVSVTTTGATLNGASGITFSGDIVGPLLRLRYTSTATGDTATMKYMLRRWSNTAGGPGGVPSYTGATGTGGSAGGGANQIQYNSGGLLAGNTNFTIDTTDLSLDLNGLRQMVLSSGIVVTDNVVVPTVLFTYDKSYNYVVIEYSVDKNSANRTGRLLIANNGTLTSTSDDYVEIGATGVAFTSNISGSNVQILFTATNTGSNGTFKYSMRKWN